MNTLSDLSTALADAVEAMSPALVYVDARRGYGATGLAWTSDGAIITSSHVVQRDDGIMVTAPGEEPVPARLVGRDQGTDIAVLRIESNLNATIRPVENDLRVGNLVLALGLNAPQPPAASFGVVAAIERPWRSARGSTINELIRSDVTLYPGFSGGPLIDAEGRVAGMNTSALTRGLAATIPWNIAEQIARTLLKDGSIARGYLGVVAQAIGLPEQMRRTAGVEQETGLLVMGVEPESPAASAELIVGDILIGIGHSPISSTGDLQSWLSAASVGDTIAISVLRGGVHVEIEAVVGKREEGR